MNVINTILTLNKSKMEMSYQDEESFSLDARSLVRQTGYLSDVLTWK